MTQKQLLFGLTPSRHRTATALPCVDGGLVETPTQPDAPQAGRWLAGPNDNNVAHQYCTQTGNEASMHKNPFAPDSE